MNPMNPIPYCRFPAILIAVAFLGVMLWVQPALGDPLISQPRTLPDRELESALIAAAKAESAKAFEGARADWLKLMAVSNAPAPIQSYAQLRIAQSYLAEKNPAAAKIEFEQIAANPAYPEVHRYEAQECAQEIDRLARGLPARDVTASRTKIPPIAAFAAEYFVAPKGSDTNPGTRQAPFASLDRARDAVRALKVSGALSGPVCVNLMPGIYPVAKTIEFTAADSGTEAAPIVYRAIKQGSAILYGGRQLKNFEPVTDPAILERLPAAVRGKVVRCDLNRAGVTNYSPLSERGYGVPPPLATLEVFFDGQPMTLARWPNQGFVNGDKIIDPGSKTANTPSVFQYLDDRPARWTNAEDAWLYGYFRHGWADRTLKIRSIDTAAKLIACGPYDLGGEKMEPVKWFNQGRIKYFAFNLLEELDQPGEWYLDRKNGMLYFYPPSDPGKAVVEIGMLSGPMLSLTAVSQVRLEGLVFDLSRSDCLVLSDCGGCLVAGCTVKRFAGRGIAINGGHADGILGCDLYSLGRGAMEVAGGDRKMLTPARHFVENCLVYSIGRLDHTYVPGIALDGVGIRAAHNLFQELPSSAIRFDGNDLLMEYNQVDRAVLESEDQGAMETWGNPTFRGNVLRYNSFASIGAGAPMEGPAGRAAIRLDDAISGTIVYGNIFYRASQSFGAINLNGGRDNVMDNNIFAECEKGITGNYDANNDRWKLLGKDPAFIMSELYLQRYPGLDHVSDQPGLNSAWRNVFWNCGSLFTTYNRPSLDKFDLMANAQYTQADAGFVDATNRDFRLKPNADVLRRIGFRPIPVNEIGLYQDEHRATWPVNVRVANWHDLK